MSKVEELRAKYSKITAATFNKFVSADKTPTKKYLEYLLKSWSFRESNNCPPLTTSLIKLVSEFDALLPYIPNKDIYAKEFNDISYLKLVIAKAEEIKEEKTFVKDEHAFVLEENDDYLLLQPLSHRGSLRYGAQTKWCTASRNDGGTFNRYTKDGVLVYLIDKKCNKIDSYKKIALYSRYNNDAVTGGVSVFNTIDNEVSIDHLCSGGWKEEEIIKVMTMYNFLFLREKKLKKSKDVINNFSENLQKLNFDSLVQHLQILEQNRNIDYYSGIQEQINKLVKSLNNINYARFTKAQS